MKKALLFIVLGISTLIMAQEQQQMDDMTLKKHIRSMSGGHTPPIKIEVDEKGQLFVPPRSDSKFTLQDFSNKYEISPERMTKVLEDMIKNRLSTPGKTPQDEYGAGHNENPGILQNLIPRLKSFHGTNTLELLGKCMLQDDDNTRYSAVETYVSITGADAIPFLREYIAEGRMKSKGYPFYFRFLKSTIVKLKEKHQHEDIEKFNVFMLDMLRVEQYAGDVDYLDRTLCITLDGYETSTQRENGIKRYINTESEHYRNHFGVIQSKLDKVPVENRIDLSKRFKLSEQQSKD